MPVNWLLEPWWYVDCIEYELRLTLGEREMTAPSRGGLYHVFNGTMLIGVL